MDRTIRFILVFASFIAMCASAPAVLANSVTDSQDVTWTVTREYNSGSGGWDIKVTTDESPPAAYWITEDSTGDEDPFVQLNPDTDQAWVLWSRQAMGGSRIYSSHFDGSDFTSPAAVTSLGTGYSDSQPHFAFESNGDIHLVWFRDYTSGTDEAFYAKYTGSWSTPEQCSVEDDAVTGSTFIKILGEDPDDLEASYDYGESMERQRCKDGDGNPWMSCSG